MDPGRGCLQWGGFDRTAGSPSPAFPWAALAAHLRSYRDPASAHAVPYRRSSAHVKGHLNGLQL